MFGKGRSYTSFQDVKDIPHEILLDRFVGVSKVPSLIKSPLRQDRSPSFKIYRSKNGGICYKDFSNGDSGTIYNLLQKMWQCSPSECWERIKEGIPSSARIEDYDIKPYQVSPLEIQVKTREFEEHDVEYWGSYGISIDLLKWANVHAITHYFFIKGSSLLSMESPKYSYAYAEKYENRVLFKIYNPFEPRFKWSGNYNRHIISLLNKIPKTGDRLIICSSLKDSLTVISATRIPCICPQGEGYSLPKDVVEDLKSRFRRIFIFFDRDQAGITNGKRMAEETGFEYLELPNVMGCKDVSDLYKALPDKEQAVSIIKDLIPND